MYKLKTIRTRKILNRCSSGHRSLMNRLITTARHEVLRKSRESNREISENEQIIEHQHDVLQNNHLSNRHIPENEQMIEHDYSNVVIAEELSPSDTDMSFSSSSHNSNIDFDYSNSNNTVDESEDEQMNTVEYFEARLRNDFIETDMNNRQASAILRTLRLHPDFSKIHIDPRTILGFSSYSHPIIKLAEGEYLHLGVAKAIVRILQSTPSPLIPRVIQIDFSTDEASLDKAGNILMWPVQIRVPNIPKCNPEVACIYKGSKKPSSPLDVISRFVDEVLSILHNGGVEFNGVKRLIELRCFIADAPARAFILGHNSHNSRVPCSRCWVTGEYLGPGNMAYRGINHRPRTNEEYSLRIDGEHHKEGECSIGRLPINLVTNTVFDYMHLVCLGVMEKIFQAIIDGKHAKTAKISAMFIKILTERLTQVKDFCPKEFARKPILIQKHGSFKATEQRQILLYSGPVVFFGLVNSAVYLHFILLHTAMRIYTNPSSTDQDINLAANCIEIFVDRAEEIYGATFLSYNVHCLLHLADDVRAFGSLDMISAFPYENNMTYFRKLCKKPHQHLQQIARRHAERSPNFTSKHIDNLVKVSGEHCRGPVINAVNFPGYRQFSNIEFQNVRISVRQKDNTVCLHNSTICVVQNIIQAIDKNYYCVVKEFREKVNFFVGVCPSSHVGVFLCSALSSTKKLVNFNEILCKCFRMPYWSESTPSKNFIPGHFVVIQMSSTKH